MTKYKPRHELTKSKDIPKQWKEIVDSGIDHIGNFLDKLTTRDVLYSLSFLCATYHAYKIIKFGKALLEDFTLIDFLSALNPMQTIFTVAKKGMEVTQEMKKESFALDIDALALAIVSAYIILKLDIDDVVSASSAITGVVKGLLP